MDKDKSTLRQMRKGYKAEHGHFPDDYKAAIDCKVCQVKELVEFAIISGAAGAPDRNAVIDRTCYSTEVKELAKARLREK